MDKNHKVNKTLLIKSKILSGREHYTHISKKYVPSRQQIVNFHCSCELQCAQLFTDEEKKEIFTNYYSLKSHNEQHSFLKSLVIPENNKTKKKIFKYFLETTKSGTNVKLIIF